jgi:hypothetical protein
MDISRGEFEDSRVPEEQVKIVSRIEESQES